MPRGAERRQHREVEHRTLGNQRLDRPHRLLGEDALERRHVDRAVARPPAPHGAREVFVHLLEAGALLDLVEGEREEKEARKRKEEEKKEMEEEEARRKEEERD